VGDPNMHIAHCLAQGIGDPPDLPASMADVRARARLVKAINRPFAGDVFPLDDLPALLQVAAFRSGASIKAFIETSALLIPDVADPIERLNLVLRLWSGCLMAAKTIAESTRSGANTPDVRRNTFAMIDEAARNDPIFEAGVEAAPAFKDAMKQAYSLAGVPDDSPVRRYAN
jgi:hypothetical protein